ncbi:hypothetical protein HKK80_02410 [Halonotius sp. F2-221B]|uniref:DUF7269 family protein n=1 Tax=Halonotius sp. F2-221B TaxID=2731620 RepID=UPI00398AB02F
MSRLVSARTVVLFVAVAVTLGFAVAVGYSPDLLPASVIRPIESFVTSLGQRTAVLAAGGLLGLLGVVAAWVWGASQPTGAFAERSVAEPSREVSVIGDSMTGRYDQRATDPDPLEDPITSSLRGTLIQLYQEAHEDSDAETYVDSGEWTTDRVAAATLTDAVAFPLWYRLYDWLYPDHAYRYRIRRALRAVEAASATELTGFAPPERTRSRLERVRGLFRSDEGLVETDERVRTGEGEQ